MTERWEYATLEWLWDLGTIKINLPGGEEQNATGTYDAVVDMLTELGSVGWEVATSTSAGNWIFWTLKRKR